VAQKSHFISSWRIPAILREYYIQKRIEDLEKLARVFDAQAEHNTAAREQTRQQIEVLKESLEQKAKLA
jgi:hypothetical protein